MKIFKVVSISACLILLGGCTLATNGLRPVKDHDLARGAITEVYDKPVIEVVEE